jgi:hypothetical protein
MPQLVAQRALQPEQAGGAQLQFHGVASYKRYEGILNRLEKKCKILARGGGVVV